MLAADLAVGAQPGVLERMRRGGAVIGNLDLQASTAFLKDARHGDRRRAAPPGDRPRGGRQRQRLPARDRLVGAAVRAGAGAQHADDRARLAGRPAAGGAGGAAARHRAERHRGGAQPPRLRLGPHPAGAAGAGRRRAVRRIARPAHHRGIAGRPRRGADALWLGPAGAALPRVGRPGRGARGGGVRPGRAVRPRRRRRAVPRLRLQGRVRGRPAARRRRATARSRCSTWRRR